MSVKGLIDRHFVVFEVSRLAVILAYNMQTVAVAWLVFTVTHRPLSLGLTGLMQFIPMALLFPFAGWVVDRFPRKWVLFVCQIGFLGASLALFALSRTAITDVKPIYGLLFFIGVMRAFSGPAVTTCLIDVVGESKYARLIPVHSVVFEIGTILGPTLGGFLFARAGAHAVFSLASGLFLLACLTTASVRVRFGARMAEGASRGLASIWMGVKYVGAQRILLGAFVLDLFAVFFGGVPNLLPVFAQDVLKVGSFELGLMRSAPAVGAGAMALFLVLRPIQRRNGVALYVAVMIFGLATIAFARSTSLPLSLGLLAVLGAADMVSVQVRMTTVQLATPPAMRGRVAAVSGLFINASNELGEFESGVTAEWWGPRFAAALGGVLTCGVVLVGAKVFPELLGVDRFDELRPKEDPSAGPTKAA